MTLNSLLTRSAVLAVALLTVAGMATAQEIPPLLDCEAEGGTLAVIDFEEATAANFITQVNADGGEGPIGVHAFNPDAPAGTNAAMIYDTLTLTCGDSDLLSATLGNILITQEYPNTCQPDDEERRGTLMTLDFTTITVPFTPSFVVVLGATVKDIEAGQAAAGAEISLVDSSSNLLTSEPIPGAGDGTESDLTFDVSAQTSSVAELVANFQGSGGLDNVALCLAPPSEEGIEGCTLGYWKQPGVRRGEWGPTGYDTSDLIGSVFAQAATWPDIADSTLLEGLNFGGGPGLEGGAMILLKQAIAALLNAAHPDVDFPLTESEVIIMTDAALASGDRDTMTDLAEEFDELNNLGCPL